MLTVPLQPIDIEMVEVPPGSITLRDDRIQRQWRVDLPAFAIGRYPVTQAQYAQLTGEQPAAHLSAQAPVESVSWIEAASFCNLLSAAHGFEQCFEISRDRASARLIPGTHGYRLPREAEWEYACRAGTTAPRYGDLDDIAWHKQNSGGRPRDVGTKAPNAWGLHDMLGNVWEWCIDLYDPGVYGPYRIFRGGGWADEERGILATNRRRSHPRFAIDDLGFRVALQT